MHNCPFPLFEVTWSTSHNRSKIEPIYGYMYITFTTIFTFVYVAAKGRNIDEIHACRRSCQTATHWRLLRARIHRELVKGVITTADKRHEYTTWKPMETLFPQRIVWLTDPPNRRASPPHGKAATLLANDRRHASGTPFFIANVRHVYVCRGLEARRNSRVAYFARFWIFCRF